MAVAETSPRPRTHVWDGLSLVCVGLAGWGAAPLLEHPGLALPALGAGVGTGTGVIILGQRAARRGEFVGYLAETLAPLLGASSGRTEGLVQAWRWTQGWPGLPRRLRLRYGTGRLKLADAPAELGDPRWVSEVAREVGDCLGGDYLVAGNDRVRGRLTLKLRTKPVEQQEKAPDTPQVIRAKKVVNELLAGTATIGSVQVDEATGEARRLEVKHEVGAKLVAPGYRNRVERTISVMLPGRWRAKWDMEGDAAVFEVRPSLPESLWIPPLDLPDSDPLANYRDVEIPYGVDEDGEAIAWRPAVTPQWLITGETGSGKLVPLSTAIPTPSGWTAMGQLRVGDQVFGRDGRPCRVEMVWPVREAPDLYRITFSDGQTVDCDLEHQWLVSDFKARKAARSRERRAAIENHRAAWGRVRCLEALADGAAERAVTLRELLEYVTARVDGCPWGTQLGLRAALAAVDCPFRIEDRVIARTTGAFARPVRLYSLPVALKALAVRVAEQHHTAPSSDAAEWRMTTGEMLAVGLTGRGGQANFAVRVTEALELPPASLPIDPYVLGAWLGGCCTSGGLTSVDSEVLASVSAAGFDVSSSAAVENEHYIRGLMPLLRSEHLLDNKHIPLHYQRASCDQRLALLQALMDTHGTVDVNGGCEISLPDHRLAADTVTLIRSLGIKASVSRDRPASYRDAQTGELIECKDRHRVHFTTTAPVFRLSRKAERLPAQVRETQKWLDITSIEPIESKPGRCITVDSPDRTYLCGEGYVPTSNTSTGHGILTQITRFGWPVWVADGKGIEFLGFQDWPNVQIVASRIEEQVAVIHRAWQLMEYRYQLVVQRRARPEDFEPLMVFVDEFTDLKANLLTWYAGIKVKGDPAKPPTLAEVGSITRKGRAARVHLVLSMQRPDADILTGEALALDTPIPTPTGWTTMGEIQPGDLVLSEHGLPVRVTGTSAVHHRRPCYRVVFSDGSEIVTDENHLWAAASHTQRNYDGPDGGAATRGERWPSHDVLATTLRALAPALVGDGTVAQFEAHLGGSRIHLLRWGLSDGRFAVRPRAVRPGVSGQFPAAIYSFSELAVLLEEVNSPAPSWHAPSQVVSTRQIAESSRTRGRGRSNWSVQVAEPVDLPPVDLPVDPWLLGYWLGDGNRHAASIATADEEVLAKITSLGYKVTDYCRHNFGTAGASAPSLKVALRDLGVLGNKHIPLQYLRASSAQRADLLAGLLDAAGTCSVRRAGTVPSGQVTFTNVDVGLIEGVRELAASLGFVPTIRMTRPAGVEQTPSSVAYGCRTRTAWKVTFTPDRQVFGITRKQHALAPALRAHGRATDKWRYIVDVQPVASVPVRCIAVDSPTHLYLAGPTFIPTHNTRENFGQRTSLGQLSPQGAQMMWNNPVTGVTIPRGRTGRAIGTNNVGLPVEMQCYRVPDPKYARPGTAEYELLQKLHPREARHERLLIVPPETDWSGEEPTDATFSDYADAEWVKAADRPDLDPLADEGDQAATVDGRALSSPLALFGLSGSHRASAPVSRRQFTEEDLEPAGGMSPDRSSSGDLDDLEDLYADGYGQPTPARAADLSIGDLIRVDDDLDTWAVVEEEPVEDFEDPESLVIAWRDDQDTSGQLIVAGEAMLVVRRPI
jgi:hypothetical protein